MRVLVTGASGFIGKYLCEYLAEQGHKVIVVSERIMRSTEPKNKLLDKLLWSKKVKGGEALVHLAGLAHIPPSKVNYQMAHAINVDYPVEVAKICADSGIQKFIYISSIKVLGEYTKDRPFNHQTQVAPQSLYATLKVKAETLITDKVGGSMELLILRPPLVYGPNVKANFLALMRAVNFGLPLPFKSLKSRRSFLFVGNLCHIINLFIDKQIPGGVFPISDGNPIDVSLLCDKLGYALGRPARLYPLPEKLVNLLPSGNQLTRSLIIDDTSLREQFKWIPPYNMDVALSTTVNWFKLRNSLDSANKQ